MCEPKFHQEFRLQNLTEEILGKALICPNFQVVKDLLTKFSHGRENYFTFYPKASCPQDEGLHGVCPTTTMKYLKYNKLRCNSSSVFSFANNINNELFTCFPF